MSSKDNDFATVKDYFSQLVSLDDAEQKEKLAELKQQDKLTDKQFSLLQNMLQADENTGFATNIHDASADLVKDAAQADDNNWQGKQVGVYEIIKTLGEGGMGSVFLAQRNDGQFEQIVALKLPHSRFNQTMLQRFENERQILAQLNHRHIAHLLDGGMSEDSQPYLVMEYIQGMDIDKYCVKNLPTLKQRIELILQVCAAVSFAHQKLVLHRDLKPSNILVTDEGEVKLLDFGIAKLLDPVDEENAKHTATQIMTRYYASPEQLQGKPASTHSDLFSLAIIAYELITGFHPFKHDTQQQREQNLISGNIMRVTQRDTLDECLYPELSTIPTGKIQGDLENILFKALSVEPDKRYESVKDFANDLRNFCNNKPVTARKPSFWYYLSKLIQRNKLVTVAIVMTLVSLIGSTVFSIKKANYAIKQQHISQRETQKAEQISDFLKTLFNKAKPQSSKKQLTVQELLTQGIETIEQSDFQFPEIKYDLLNVMHNSLIALGEIAKSDAVLAKHIKECQTILSPTHKSCIQLLIQQSKIYHYQTNSEGSIKLLKKAEKLALSKTPQDKKELVSIYAEMTSDLLNLNKNEEAKNYMKKIEQIEKLSKNPDYSRLFEVTHELATIDIFNQDFASAWQYIQRNTSYIDKFPSEQQDKWKKHLFGLNSLYFTVTNNAKKAYEFRKKRLNIESQFEVKSHSYGRTLLILGDLAIRAGYFDKAEKYLTQAYQFFLQNISNSEYHQFKTLSILVYFHSLLNQNTQAKKYFDILQQAINKSGDTQGYTESVSYLKAKTLIKFMNINSEQAESEYNKVNNSLKDLSDHMRHHELFTQYLKIKVKIAQKDKQSASKSWQNFKKMLDKFPNDYFTLKKASELLGIEIQSLN